MAYTQQYVSKIDIVSEFNFEFDNDIDRTTFYKKNLKTPVKAYNDLFLKVRNLYFNTYKPINNFNIVAVDGTYNNTNVKDIKGNLETTLNMSYYLVNECIPLDISFCGEENKNCEVKQLMKYIKDGCFNNINNLKNIVIVADRAYYTYELFNFLDANNLKYIIRIRNNAVAIKNKDVLAKKITNHINIRIIYYTNDVEKIKKDKDKKDVKIIEKTTCYVITNLTVKEYNDEEINKIYMSRWNIEVFFKLLKSNFKFKNLVEHCAINTKNKTAQTIDEYNKLYYSILIIIYIALMVDKINSDFIKETPLIKPKNKKNKKNKKISIIIK